MSGFAGRPVRAPLAGKRWHFQHGPIDLILVADGEAAVCDDALTHCWRRFQTILEELVAELPHLRQPVDPSLPGGMSAITGAVASRMSRACARFATERFLTPMAAVAGAVADELLRSFERPGITRAYINNGGDIALLLAPGQQYQVGVWANLARLADASPARVALDGTFRVHANMPVRGVATSGWRGRSFSLGIADSVTVLATDAALADAAATVIANAVDCDHPGIVRVPANQMKDDTDLGYLPVTVRVPPLSPQAIACALSCGRAEAEHWWNRGELYAAAIFLQGQVEIIAPAPHPIQHREVA